MAVGNARDTEDPMAGARLKQLRVNAGMRLVDLAGATGISPSLLSRIETGHRHPTAELAQRLSVQLGVTIQELAGTDENRQMQQSSTDAHWPTLLSQHPTDADEETNVLADMALSVALRASLETLATAPPAERFRACHTLAALASRPLEALLHTGRDDPDPLIREAAFQMLAMLAQSYCER